MAVGTVLDALTLNTYSPVHFHPLSLTDYTHVHPTINLSSGILGSGSRLPGSEIEPPFSQGLSHASRASGSLILLHQALACRKSAIADFSSAGTEAKAEN